MANTLRQHRVYSLLTVSMLLALTSCVSVKDTMYADPKIKIAMLSPFDSPLTLAWRITYNSNAPFPPDCNKGAYQRTIQPLGADVPSITHVIYDCDSQATAHVAFARLSAPDPLFVGPLRVMTSTRARSADEFNATCGDWPNNMMLCKFIARYGDRISIVTFSRYANASEVSIHEADVLHVVVGILDARMSQLLIRS